MFVTVALLLLLTVLLAALLTSRWWHFSYFKRIGIPGPKPNLIWGNLAEYHSMDVYKIIGKWIKKYGDTFGFYDGDVPFIVTQDLDLIEEVCVRSFSNFTGRGMMPLIDEYIDGLLASMKDPACSDCEVNMVNTYEQLSMHVLGHVSFGVDCRAPESPGHSIVTVVRYVSHKIMAGPLHMIAQSTTFLGRLMKPLTWISLLAENHLMVTRRMAEIVETRRKNCSYRRHDILQHLLDTEYAEIKTRETVTKKENGRMKTRPLTTLEVTNCATTIFVAGNETIASALSYLTFVLAKYPDVEDKVRQEVVDTFSDQDKLDFETLMKRQNYLEQVISETLRLYPPGLTFVTRQAKEDFAHKGTLFKAGTCFMVPLYQIQRDPRFWPDPLQFNPDRFAPENEAQLVKAAYMPFGVGPRNCVGKSMAMLTLKLAMAKLLLKYHLELGPSQKGEMQISSRAMVSTPTRGPWIIIRHINGHL
ncbi:cytochrome P450 3A14 isoform X2 [Rhipicephalus microplus]|uniref:cytochrome P450 3A14 isoform X2 n=1 Tax=Rhipicephalus microplus TaxID=6941 RepID=UPI003F6D971B